MPFLAPIKITGFPMHRYMMVMVYLVYKKKNNVRKIMHLTVFHAVTTVFAYTSDIS